MDHDYFSHFANKELKLYRIACGQKEGPWQGKELKKSLLNPTEYIKYQLTLFNKRSWILVTIQLTQIFLC